MGPTNALSNYLAVRRLIKTLHSEQTLPLKSKGMKEILNKLVDGLIAKNEIKLVK